MTLEQLKEKAASLPMTPGVYLMRDQSDRVIYVGKAKKLRNRVGQYFQDSASHTPKTRLMVSKIHHFDVIIASSEFEALVLECNQIKQYSPKYNILLKDDKGYPYLRLNMKEAYPRITLANRPSDDGASYFGPYGSRGVSQTIIETVNQVLRLPGCNKIFPRDLGKGRHCLNYHMGRCEGWCQMENPQEDYRLLIEQARQLLLGNYKQVANALRVQMLKASEHLNFELAAVYRDRLNSVQALSQKQIVTAGKSSDTDIIGYGETEVKACFAVLHYSGGNLVDKDFEVFSVPEEKERAVNALVKQYYLSRGFAPKQILVPFRLEDDILFEELLFQQYGKKSYIKMPQRGDNVRLVELACKNAYEEALRITGKEEKTNAILSILGKMLSIDVLQRIEAYDISNISGTDNVGSMVVFENGKPKKSEYKRFRIDNDGHQDDYGSMQQMLTRRFENYQNGEKGFDRKPDLLLIDGGITHARAALAVLDSLKLSFPVFGMVKDDRHRTRALVTPQGEEIHIDRNQSIFSFIGTIQEETHRFAISYHKMLRSKHLRKSKLDRIAGIGPKRKAVLLSHFGTVAAIEKASIEELSRIVPKNTAEAVYHYFHSQEGEK